MNLLCVPRKAILGLLSLYKRFLSPFLAPACRFYPSCSSYAYEAIERYGIAKGGIRTLTRLLKCHPFYPGGYDPLK